MRTESGPDTEGSSKDCVGCLRGKIPSGLRGNDEVAGEREGGAGDRDGREGGLTCSVFTL